MSFVPRIRTILVGAFLLAAGLPLVVFWAWPQTSFKTFQMDEVHNRQTLLARNLAASLGGYHDDLVTALRSFAPLIADGRGEEVRTSLEKLHFTRICVVNPDTGAVTRAFLGAQKACPDWYSEARRAMFVDLAGNAGVGISPAAFSVNGPPELILATRAYDVLIVGAVSTQFFKDLRIAADASGDGYTAIVDQTGHVLAHPVRQLQDTPTDLGYMTPVQQILAGNLGAIDFKADSDGADLVAGFAVVDGPGWGVFIPRPVSNLHRAANRIEQEGLMVLALALCLSAVMGLLIARFISNQVSGIQQTTRQMAEGDRTARVVKRGPGTPRIRELSELGASLNQMADDIDTAHESELHLREAAGQAAAAKSEFLENLSGEIRTPVTNMLTIADLVRDGDVTDLQSRQLDAVADQGRTLMGLLDDILDFSQIESGRMDFREEPVDLASITLSVVRLMMPAAARKGVEIITQVPPEAPLIMADAGRLRQFLLNLVGNAVKFTNEGQIFVGLQIVAADPDAASVQIEVTDTGIGISPDRMDTIFTAFDSCDSDQSATGLGLTICQRITSAMNGSLAVESELGVGSSFLFIAQLPIASSPAEDVAPISGAFSDLRVMLLAAHEKQRDVLTSYLQSYGMTERRGVSADPALKVMAGDTASGSGIDVMIYDPAGFDFSVTDLQRLVTQHAEQRSVRLIVLTDHVTLISDISETAELLDKPIVPSDLCAALLQASMADATSPGSDLLDQPVPDILPMEGHDQTGRPGFLRPVRGSASHDTAPLQSDDSNPEPDTAPNPPVQLFTISSIHGDGPTDLPQMPDVTPGEVTPGDATPGGETDVIEPMPQAITAILDHPEIDVPNDPASGAAARTAILMDGNPESRADITMVLDQFDISTEVVKDGNAALRVMLSAPDVAAVLIDLNTMSGEALEAARRISDIKTDLCFKNCMIIGLAESGRGTQERDLRAAGFTHLLKKPVKISGLRRLFGPENQPKPAKTTAKSA